MEIKKLWRRIITTNVNTTIKQIAPNGSATNSGVKIGYISSIAKAAQYDTITFTNASVVLTAGTVMHNDVTGVTAVPCAITSTANKVFLNDTTTGTVSGIIIYM